MRRLRTNTRFQVPIFVFFAAFVVMGGESASAFDCDTEQTPLGDSITCVSIPDEVPQQFPPAPSKKTLSGKGTTGGNGKSAKGSSRAKSPMVAGEELSGATGIDQNEFDLGLPIAEARSSAPGLAAVRASSRVQEQLRSVETFLKSGPAARGDLTVITTGKKDK